jgi:2,5-dioxopentanoate dehydrogenase
MRETHLPEARLRAEKGRTVLQWRQYADACEKADWMEIRIQKAKPPAPDLRKMMVPLGPVAVFGASNFPFAYSTAGGDTACAFAAGCPVVLKAHPAHPETSLQVAELIQQALKKHDCPASLFIHLHDPSFELSRLLVTHPLLKAVGFTGSLTGGRQLFNWAAERPEPIPVFAEMGSINPVFLLPGKLAASATETAQLLAASITLGTGQFCTNPGLMIGIRGEELYDFMFTLKEEIDKVNEAPMLHEGISSAYTHKKNVALAETGMETLAIGRVNASLAMPKGLPEIALVSAKKFINSEVLKEEVFGPYSLLVECDNEEEMYQVARSLHGQLTASVFGTDEEIKNAVNLMDAIQQICGRFILNGVPTGVEVSRAMQHGGPYPASTDSRFTSVGADGIKRFARPVCYQNWPDALLPDELKESNPLGLWRLEE